MTTEEFEALVADEVASIPARFERELRNVVFLVKENPSAEELTENGVPPGDTLLGLFVGVTLGDRGNGPWELPSRITIFKEPNENEARELRIPVREVVHATVWHEVAHFLGMEEVEVRSAERNRAQKRAPGMPHDQGNVVS